MQFLLMSWNPECSFSTSRELLCRLETILRNVRMLKFLHFIDISPEKTRWKYMNYTPFNKYHQTKLYVSWKSSLLDNISEREAILVLFGFSEVNNTWPQRPSNSLITSARIDRIFYRFTGVIDHVGCWESRRNDFRITRLLFMSYKSAG